MTCIRCGSELPETENITLSRRYFKTGIVRRGAVCFAVLVAALVGFYVSLVFSAKPLEAAEKAELDAAIGILEEKGFKEEVFVLRRLAVFRGSDNWLNSVVAKENAYAATNFPFEIVTVYPEFFAYPADETEQAAILLHEARHLLGNDEKQAYEYVWKNRKRLGWASGRYRDSPVWLSVRKQTREYSPGIFVCDFNEFGDCTE